MNSLRKLQYEYNLRKSAMFPAVWGSDGVMRLYYSGGNEGDMQLPRTNKEDYESSSVNNRDFITIRKHFHLIKGLCRVCGEIKQGVEMDLTEELKDLLECYRNKLEVLTKAEESRMDQLIMVMRSFLSVNEQKKTIEFKLSGLVQKLQPDCDCNECDEEEDDE